MRSFATKNLYYLIYLCNRILYFPTAFFLSLKISGRNLDIFISYPFFIRGTQSMQIGTKFKCWGGARIECVGKNNKILTRKLTIGNNVSCGSRIHIAALFRISIGDNCLIGSNVFITDHNHGDYSDRFIGQTLNIIPSKRKLHSPGEVVIGKNVWIGENVAILPGVKVGPNAVIGSNSVLTKSFPGFCIIAGNPARIIKTLTS